MSAAESAPWAIVVGGGIAGLLAARRLQRAGHRVLVLEAEDRPGGAIRAERLGGIDVNAGAEAYSTAGGVVDALLAELGLDGEAVAPREGLGSRLVSANGVHASPRGTLLGIPGQLLSPEVRAVLGPLGTLRALLDRVLPAPVGDRPGASVGAYVRTRMGRRVSERLVAPMVGGVHSSDPETLELAAANPRLLPAVREHGSLAAAVRALRASGPGASAGTAVRSLRPTMARLPERLAELLAADGGEIRCGVRVDGLSRTVGPEGASTPDGAGWMVTAGSETLPADHLVLACPPDVSRALLQEAAPQVAAQIPQAPSSPVRLVALLLDSPELARFPVGTGALVAPGTPGVRAKALTHATAKWEHVGAAAAPHQLVRLSYGRPGEDLPAEEDLVEIALRDAAAITGAPLDRSCLLDARVITWDRAMRQALPGHREALQRLSEELSAQPDLELVGAWRAGTGIAAIVRADAEAATPPVPARP